MFFESTMLVVNNSNTENVHHSAMSIRELNILVLSLKAECKVEQSILKNTENILSHVI